MKNNERGATLVFVMIFSSVALAILASLNSQIFTNISANAHLDMKSNFDTFIWDLRSTFDHPNTCTLALGGQTITVANGAKTKSLNLPNSGLGSTITPGWTQQGLGFSVYDIGIHLGDKRAEVSSGVAGTYPNGYYDSYNAKLFISAESCSTSNTNCTSGTSQMITNEVDVFTDPSQYNQINLVVYLDQAGTIQTCFANDSLGELCELTGGVWNVSEPDPAFRCNPYRVCFLERDATTGDAVRSSATGAVACNNPRYTPEPMGLGTNGNDIRFTCRWCNVNDYRSYP